jgi:hypothetical protein
MRIFKMRNKLHLHGLVLLEHGDGFMVTDQGVKNPIEVILPDILAVEKWYEENCRFTSGSCPLCDAGIPVEKIGDNHGKS